MRQIRHLPVAPEVPAFGLVPLDGAAAEGSPPADAAFAAELGEVEHGEDGESLLQVGDLARASGKTVRAIHHYEEVGLLRPHARSKGRYRLYDASAIARVRWIDKLHDLGLSLSQIQEMVQLWETAPSASGAMSRIRGLYVEKLQDTREQIAHLTTLERELEASIEYLDTCGTCDPAELVRACTCCNYHDKNVPEPHLVAGIHGGVGAEGARAS
jgi:MerR family transcriptional regulator, copper efflux regulator